MPKGHFFLLVMEVEIKQCIKLLMKQQKKILLRLHHI